MANWQQKNDNERELIERAKVDPNAFGELYEMYVDKIYNYVFRQVGTAAVCEDIVAQTFMKVLENLPKFQWKGISISSWIYRIATNEVYQFFRNKQKKKTVNIDVVEHLVASKNNPHHVASRKDTFIYIYDYVEKLPETQKMVITLRFVEGLNNQEIGEIIGKKEGAVRQLVFRALTKLREWLPEGTL